MKLPNFRRLIIEDFPKEFQSLVDKLSLYINPNFEQVYNALANRLNFTDNFDATVKTINVVVDANGLPVGTAIVKLNLVNNTIPRASGTLITRAENLTNSRTYPSGGIFINFTQNQDTLQINHITGLTAGDTYSLNIVVYHS